MKKLLVIVAFLISIQPVKASLPQCNQVLSTQNSSLDAPQFALRLIEEKQLLSNADSLHKRDQKMTELFHQLAPKVENRSGVSFRDQPTDRLGVRSMTLIKNIFPDFDSATEFIIGLQEPMGPGDVPHSYLLVGGQRFDGNGFGDVSWSRRSSTVIKGLVFRVGKVNPHEIEKLTEAVKAMPSIVDINCYSGLFRLLETSTSLRLKREKMGLPMLPSEYVVGLLQNSLIDMNGGAPTIEAVNLMSQNFVAASEMLLQFENQLILLDPRGPFTTLNPEVTDYHQALGFSH